MDTGLTGVAEAAVDAASFEKAADHCYSENFNCADFADEEEMHDVVESFELLHRTIPWLQRADVSSESHCGQLKILQAAIDYIIDLEEQLDEHLSGDLYMAAIQSGRAAIQHSLTAGRRPFADVNAEPPPPPPPPSLTPQPLPSPRVSPDFPLTPAGLSDNSAADLNERQC